MAAGLAFDALPPPGPVLGVANRARLAVVHELGLPGHVGDPELDAAVQTLAAGCRVPMAVVNIVSPDLQTYPAEIGVGTPCTTVPDAVSFCAEVVETGRPLTVADATRHAVYAGNPLVAAGSIKAYAGEPLVHNGAVVGSVSIFDTVARHFGQDELDVLRAQTRLVAAVIALRLAARQDPLTGLANRDRITEHGRQTLAAGPASVLFIDVEGLQDIHDAHGHVAGEQQLRDLAIRFARALATGGGALARWGGEEFIALLPGADLTTARRTAERITEELSRVGGERLGASAVTVSVGVASAATASAWEGLVRDAGAAARLGKSAGRNTVFTYTTEMRERAIRRADMQAALQQAVRDGALTLAYQPVLRTADRTLGDVEALVRWPRDDGTHVSPAEFIPLAEDSELILTLGAHVLDLACQQAAAWRETYPAASHLRVWVNVSPRQLDQPDFPAEVQAALRRHRLPAAALGIEVTETVAADDRPHAIQALDELRRHGVKVALDDFGTGYSSLGQLRQLPIDELKLDRAFVAGLGPEQTVQLAFARAVIELGHALNMPVVAEGVERPEERDTLLALGCDYLQGYLIGRPTPAISVPAAMGWITDQPHPPRAHTRLFASTPRR